MVTYEGVLGLALLAVAAWVMQDVSDRWRRGVVAGVPVVVVAAGGATSYLPAAQLAPRGPPDYGGSSRRNGAKRLSCLDHRCP